MDTTVLLWIDDLFSRTQLQQKLSARQVQTQIPLNLQDVLARLQDDPRSIVITDSQNAILTPENIQSLKPFAERIVVFYPHVQHDRAAALEKQGLRHVYPRSRVFEDPVNVLEQIMKG